MSHQHSLFIRVEFPALDNLVAFLREEREYDTDALTAKVRAATAALKPPTEALSRATTENQNAR